MNFNSISVSTFADSGANIRRRTEYFPREIARLARSRPTDSPSGMLDAAVLRDYSSLAPLANQSMGSKKVLVLFTSLAFAAATVRAASTAFGHFMDWVQSLSDGDREFMISALLTLASVFLAVGILIKKPWLKKYQKNKDHAPSHSPNEK